MQAIKARFADWQFDYRLNTNEHPLYTGEYIYYDLNEENFNYRNVNVDSFTVIVFYSKCKDQAEIHYYQKQVRNYIDTKTKSITVQLVDAKTKVFFVRRIFSSTDPNGQIRQRGSTTTNIDVDSREVTEYINSYFPLKKN